MQIVCNKLCKLLDGCLIVFVTFALCESVFRIRIYVSPQQEFASWIRICVYKKDPDPGNYRRMLKTSGRFANFFKML